jgi:hypothetical protein
MLSYEFKLQSPKIKQGNKQDQDEHRRKLILPISMSVYTQILSSLGLSSISEQITFLS